MEKKRAPAYLPPGYKNSTRVRQLDTPPGGTVARERDHWDGRKDARVYPETVKSSFDSLAEKSGVSRREAVEMRKQAIADSARRVREARRAREER